MERARPPRWPPRQTWRRRAGALGELARDPSLAKLPFLALLATFLLVVTINDRLRMGDPRGAGALAVLGLVVVAVCTKGIDWRVQREARWVDEFDLRLTAPPSTGVALTPVEGPPWPEWLSDHRALRAVAGSNDVDVLRAATGGVDVIVALTRSRHIGRWPHVVVLRRLGRWERSLVVRPSNLPGRRTFATAYRVRPETAPVPAALQAWLMTSRRRVEVDLDGDWLALRPSFGARRKANRSIRRGPAVADEVAALLDASREVVALLDAE